MLERRQYKLGKYDIVAQARRRLRCTCCATRLHNGKRLGALTLGSDRVAIADSSKRRRRSRPLRIFSVTFRPGRPRKDAQRPNGAEGGESGPVIPWTIKGQQRY